MFWRRGGPFFMAQTVRDRRRQSCTGRLSYVLKPARMASTSESRMSSSQCFSRLPPLPPWTRGGGRRQCFGVGLLFDLGRVDGRLVETGLQSAANLYGRSVSEGTCGGDVAGYLGRPGASGAGSVSA